MKPTFSDNEACAYCSYEDCDDYDGKRCKLTGFKPDCICEPWVIGTISGLRKQIEESNKGEDNGMSKL